MKSAFRNMAAVAALLAAVALAPASAPAYMGDNDAAPTAHRLEKMTKELHLTPQQQQQVKEIFARNRPRTEPLIKQLMIERRALRDLTQAENIDEAAIKAQSARIAVIQTDLAINRAHVSHEIRGVLTLEQIVRAKGLQARRDKKIDEGTARFGKRFEQEP